MARLELLKAGGGSYLGSGDALLGTAAGPTAKTLVDSAAATDSLRSAAAVLLADSGAAADQLTVSAGFVQTVGTQLKPASAVTTVITLAGGVTTTVGNRLILAYGGTTSSGADTLTVTDSKGNTWTADQTATGDVFARGLIASTVLTAALVPGDTITVTQSGTATGNGYAACYEWQGLGAPVGHNGTYNGTGSTTPAAGGASMAAGAVYTGFLMTSNAAAPVPGALGSPWVPRDTAQNASGTRKWYGTWDRVEGVGATIDFAPTLGTSTIWLALEAAYTLTTQAASVTLTDQGQATDQAIVAAAVPLPESAAAADAVSASQGATPKTLADSAAATDTLRPSAAVPLVDAAAAADTVTVNKQLAVFVQTVGTQQKPASALTTVITLAAGITTTVGNRLVLAWGGTLSNSADALTVSDSKGNTWTVAQRTGGISATGIFASTTLTAALVTGDTITVTQGGTATANGWAACYEWSGLATPITSNGATATSSSPSSGNVAMTTAAVFFGLLVTSNATTPVAGTLGVPWTTRDSAQNATGTRKWYGTWDRVEAASATLAHAPTIGQTTLWADLETAFTVATQPPTATLVYAWAGAVTPTSAAVVVSTAFAASSRLKVSTTADLLTSPVFSSSVSVDSDGYARLPITGLTAATTYYYGVELDGTIVGGVGSFKTAPSGAASFSFAFGSCALTGAATSWTRAAARNPDLCIICGDFPYSDVTTNNQVAARDAREALVSLPDVQAMVKQVATAYTWSDHDFGTNNANTTAASKPAAQVVYRQQVPSHTLEVGDGIYHSFVYGRVRFILTDNRSFKSVQSDTDNSSKTILGTTQKTWFKNLITSATEPLIIWVNEQPWIGAAVAGEDEWSGYTTERAELANHITAAGKRVVIVSGDMHAVAADDGTNSAGGIPVLHGAPWRNTFSNKGGPYTSGPYPTSDLGTIQQYGFVQVTDTGAAITVAFNGYDDTDVSRVSLTRTFVTLTDSAAAADTFATDQAATAKTLTDQGTAGDSLRVAAQVTLADDASHAETTTTTRSRLVWRSGVHEDGFEGGVLDFETWRGRLVDLSYVYSDRSSWANIENPSYPLNTAFPGERVIAQPMWPEGSGGSLTAAAAGSYDSHWQAYGTWLAANGHATQLTALAWEFNGNWFEWSATNAADFIAAWRRIVDAVRSTCPGARFAWVMNAHDAQNPPSGHAMDAYPGDGYVDVIGIDAYDTFPASTNDTEWNSQLNAEHGMGWLLAICRQKHKPLLVPEWGVALVAAGGAGDNPFYVGKMLDFFRAHTAWLYGESYFDAGNTAIRNSGAGANPNSAQAYLNKLVDGVLTVGAQTPLVQAAAAADSVTVAVPAAKTLTDSGAGTDRLCHDGGPTGAPDCLLAEGNLTGPLTSLWDDPQTPDANWLTAVDPTQPTETWVSFPTPATAPGSGGPTEFQCWLRKTGAGADPAVTIQAWESGLFLRTLTTTTLTSTVGQLVTATLTPSDLLDPSGAGVELRIVITPFAYDTLVLTSDSNAAAQAKIDAAASSAVVGFEPGVHPERKVTPKLGQTLRGHPAGTTIFDGSRLVTGWTGSNPWVATHTITDRGVFIDTTGIRTAVGDDVGSQYPEELFYVTPGQNSGWTRKERQGQPTTAAPSVGKWTMDYTTGTLRVADDPTATQVRISVTDTAVVAPTLAVGGLTVEDITFQKYATDIWHSAAGHGGDHRDWTYRRVAMLDCHGSGFYLGPGDTVTRSRSAYNGFEGLSAEGEAGGYSAGFTMTDTEIAWNKKARYDWAWEGGGSKFDTPTSGTGPVIRNCWWHHNHGPGIWADLNLTETSASIIESNLIEDNLVHGIFWEITAGTALIRWNRVRRNGVGSVANTGGPAAFDWTPGVFVSNSRGVTITQNVFDDNASGFLAIDDDRDPFLDGCSVQGNSVKSTLPGGNSYHMRFQAAGSVGAARIATCGADSNRYWGTERFNYGLSSGSVQTFAQWQAVRAGPGLTGALDPNGTAGLTGTVTDPAGFVPFRLRPYGPGAVP